MEVMNGLRLQQQQLMTTIDAVNSVLNHFIEYMGYNKKFLKYLEKKKIAADRIAKQEDKKVLGIEVLDEK